MPRELLSDQGKEFCNQVVDRLCHSATTRHALSSAYRPQTNGLVERFNQTLCRALAKFTQQYEDDWDLFIPSVLFAYRTKTHTTTRFEPFNLVYGRAARLPIELQIPAQPLSSETSGEDTLLHRIYAVINELPPIWKKAREYIKNAQEVYKQRHDDTITRTHTFQIGDQVWLHDTQRKDKSHSHKLVPQWTGPYYIHDVLDYGAYRLRDIENDEVLPHTYHGTRLKLFITRVELQPAIVI